MAGTLDIENIDLVDVNLEPKIEPRVQEDDRQNSPHYNNSHNILLTGVPRSGTTLTCHLLNKVPNTVALHEPMTVRLFAELPNHSAICDQIDTFMNQVRHLALTKGTVISKHINGQIPDNPVSAKSTDTGLRPPLATHGEIPIEKKLDENFDLVIKHPGAFSAVIEGLVDRFPCYAIVRNPLSILGSWNSISMAHRTGHAPAAERLDKNLANKLETISDNTDRQIYLLSWFFDKFLQVLPDTSIIRYENIIASQGRAIEVITPAAQNLTEPLMSKNKNPAYDRALFQLLGTALLKSDGAYWHFYDRASVEQLLAEMI